MPPLAVKCAKKNAQLIQDNQKKTPHALTQLFIVRFQKKKRLYE
jgi:hypothetical protein